jgi:hypothetical protein
MQLTTWNRRHLCFSCLPDAPDLDAGVIGLEQNMINNCCMTSAMLAGCPATFAAHTAAQTIQPYNRSSFNLIIQAVYCTNNCSCMFAFLQVNVAAASQQELGEWVAMLRRCAGEVHTVKLQCNRCAAALARTCGSGAAACFSAIWQSFRAV